MPFPPAHRRSPSLPLAGLLNTLLCTSTRVAVSAAKLRILPASLAKVHEPSGTPRRATAALSLLLAGACALPFSQLVSISMLFYGATTLFEFLALLKLRRSEALTPRPFRIALSLPLLTLCCMPPMALCVLLIFLAPWEAWALFGAATCAGVAASAFGGVDGCMHACRHGVNTSKCPGGIYDVIESAVELTGKRGAGGSHHEPSGAFNNGFGTPREPPDGNGASSEDEAMATGRLA